MYMSIKTLDYVIFLHQANLSKTTKHWDGFVSHCNYITSIMHRIKNLKIEASMENMDTNLRKMFSKVFQPIPYVDKLPSEPWLRLP